MLSPSIFGGKEVKCSLELMKLWNRLANYPWDYCKTNSVLRMHARKREPSSANLSETPRQHSCKVSVTCCRENSSLFLSLPLAYLCTLDSLSLLTRHALQIFLSGLFFFTSFLRLFFSSVSSCLLRSFSSPIA